MEWNNIKHFFDGETDEVFEVYYDGMTPEAWARVFEWTKTLSDIHVFTSYETYIDIAEISYEKYIAGEESYIIYYPFHGDFVIDILIIDEDKIEMSIEYDAINSERRFLEMMAVLDEIWQISGVEQYLVCPEFKKSEAFIINGQAVHDNS